MKKKKMKKLFWNFARLYLGIDWHDLFQIWLIDSPSSGVSVDQIWLNSGKWSQSYIGLKITFFVFLHGVMRWLLGPHNTLPCVMLATVAFGMRVGCPDVRQIIHFGAPADRVICTGNRSSRLWWSACISYFNSKVQNNQKLMREWLHIWRTIQCAEEPSYF